MVSETTRSAFYEGQRSERYPLAVNDVVSVKTGERSGARAWVISIQSEDSDPMYLVEYDDGSDQVVPLSRIDRNENDGG